MAITRNFMLKEMSGHVGKQMIFKKYGDKTVISVFPDMSNRKITAKQVKVQEMMEEANWAAKVIMGDSKLRMEAQVRLNVTSNKLYTALIKEYFQKARAANEAAQAKNSTKPKGKKM